MPAIQAAAPNPPTPGLALKQPEAFGFSRTLLIFVAVITLARLLAAAGIHLTEDEAYYRQWAEHLRLGYYDHPPMIAWWAWAGQRIVGPGALGVRLLPVLSCALTTLVVFDIARLLGGDRKTAERAAIWFNATSLVAFGGQLATPDAPACLFWTLTLWALAKAWRGGSGPWWVAAGVTAGLACLSKYSALFLAPGVLVWLAMAPGGWKVLKRPWPWIAALLAVAIFSANVAWNAQHHWVTFERQFGRIAPHHFTAKNAAAFLGVQFLLLNPLIAVFAGRGAWAAWKARSDPGAGGRLLLLGVSLPFAAYLLLHSLHDKVQAHWPVPLYAALALLAAFAAEREDGLARLRPWVLLSLPLAALALVHMAVPASDRLIPGGGALPVRGWTQLAHGVEAARAANNAAWAGALSYGPTAQLQAEGVIEAPVLELSERDRYAPDDASWRADLAKPGVVVDLERRATMDRLVKCFASIRPLAGLDRAAGRRQARYSLYLVSGPIGDPLRKGCPL